MRFVVALSELFASLQVRLALALSHVAGAVLAGLSSHRLGVLKRLVLVFSLSTEAFTSRDVGCLLGRIR